MKLIALTIAIIMSLPICSFSQTIIFKNGKSKKVKSYIYCPNDTTTAKCYSGNTKKYKSLEIDSMLLVNVNYKWMESESPNNEFKWFLNLEGAGCCKGGYGGISASFGKQFNPYFYFGGGSGFKYGAYRDPYHFTPHTKYFEYDESGKLISSYPLLREDCDDVFYEFINCLNFFANIRINYLKDKRLMPFTDFQAGIYSQYDKVKPDFNCQFGLRIATNNISRAINLSIGFDVKNAGVVNKYDYKNICYFSAKFGWEF